jgi:hypothetical protein
MIQWLIIEKSLPLAYKATFGSNSKDVFFASVVVQEPPWVNADLKESLFEINTDGGAFRPL